MINVSSKFIQLIPKPGKTKDTYIVYEQKEVKPHKAKISFVTTLFKSTMRGLELEIKNSENIIDKEIKLYHGLYIDKQFEYVNYGTFKITECEDVIKENKIKATAYDNMVKFMVKYSLQHLKLNFPCTIRKLVQAICDYIGVEAYSFNFFNSDLIIEEDLFTALNCTYRDIIDYICQATLTTAIIKDDKLYFKSIEHIDLIIGPEVLKTLTLKSKFGPCNSLVLGRGDLNDNIFSKNNASIESYGLQEIRFDNNEILDKKREKVVDQMFKQIEGLEYNAFEATDLGLGVFEAADMIKVQDTQEKEYLVLILGASITITSGTAGTMESDEPSTSTTKYQYASDSEKKLSKTEIIVDKQEKKITAIVQEQTEHENKLTQYKQDIDSIRQQVSDTVDYRREAEGVTQLFIENAGQADILRFEVKGNRTYENNLYFRPNLYFRANLQLNQKGG